MTPELKTKAMALVVMTIMMAIDLALKEEMKISLSKRGHCKEKKIPKSMMEEVIHLIGINSLMKTTQKEMTKLDLVMLDKEEEETMLAKANPEILMTLTSKSETTETS